MTQMIYEVTDDDGGTNRIIAADVFVEEVYPGRYVLIGPVEVPVPAPTLAPLSRRRLRLGLLSIGIRSADVEAVIAAIPDPLDREWAMIEWQDASEYERDHPLLVDAAATFSLPPEQIDALWVWAASL